MVKHAIACIPSRPLTVVDIGCGSGDGLRALARWGKASGVALELIGLDANPAVINVARDASQSEPQITYLVEDAFGPGLRTLHADIIVANQFLHHFTTEELHGRLPALIHSAQVLAISDLHRHAFAHAGFNLLARLLRAGPVALHDGKVSIRRGFTRRELEELTHPLATSHKSIDWRVPFRFEMVLVA